MDFRAVKLALLDRRLNGTVSLFRITKDNVLVTDPASSGFGIAAGRARSRGVQADLNYEPDDRLTLTAVYAYTSTKVLQDTRPQLVGSRLSNVPRHSGALYGFWQSDRAESGSFGIGAGLTYVDARAPRCRKSVRQGLFREFLQRCLDHARSVS